METIKVKETHSPKHFIGLMQKVFNVEQVLVAEAKLVLVECKAHESLLWVNNGRYGLSPHFTRDIKNAYYKPILISETEKIAKDWKGWAYKEDVEGKVFKHFYTTNTWYNDAKIVLALPEHFSPKLIQDIVDGKLKDGDKVLVECIGTCTNCGESHEDSVLCYDTVNFFYDSREEPFYIKLNSSGHITLHKLEEKKYSKDDLRQAFVTGYWLHLDSDNNDLRTRVDKFEKWFNERFGS